VKKKYDVVTISFEDIATFTMKGKDGKEIIEEYGKAKLAISNAFIRTAKQLIAEGKIFNGNAKLNSGVQYDRLVDEKTGRKEKLENPIIRVKINFKKDKQNAIDINTRPDIEIYDLEKPAKHPPGSKRLPFEYATVDNEPLTFGNIHKFITYGSSCSGTENISQISLSAQGISLTPVLSLAVIKKSAGLRPVATEVFDVDEFSSMISAVVLTEEQPAKVEVVTKEQSDTAMFDNSEALPE